MKEEKKTTVLKNFSDEESTINFIDFYLFICK